MTRTRSTDRRTHSATRDRWLVSYADFMTLLFAFFTTLYAVSAVDAGKPPNVTEALQRAFTEAPAAKSTAPAPQGANAATQSIAAKPDPRAEIERELGDELASHRLQFIQDKRGLVLSIPEAGTFPAGSADMSPAFVRVVDRLSRALGRLPNSVRVEGHTDDAPIHTARYTSNWELSTSRATQVVAYLIESGVSPDRLSAAGYGEFHPLVENSSADARARNRRVDVVILDADPDAAAPAAEGTRR